MTRGDAAAQGAVGGTARRPLLKLAVGGAALASVGVAARVALHPGDEEPPVEDGALVLAGRGDSDVRSLEVRLGDDLLPRAADRRWESRRLPTSVHSMIGFTWSEGQQPPVVRIRSRRTDRGGERWGPWTAVPLLLDLPDDEEATGRVGTDLVWIGRSTGVQVRVEGHRPRDLTLVLLHPARRAADLLVDQQVAARAAEEGTEGQTDTQAPRPDLVGRGDWGANENLRDSRPSYIDTIRQVHVHHTVNANDYDRADVPALIRGMYAYHTQSLGWSDIGYNFLVDRFGRMYVGRAGGPGKLVRGAHTLGFNHNSTGISAIGNFESGSPTSAMLDGIAAIAAWKLARFDRDPRGRIRVTSEGSDRFPSGRTVELPVIDGHRDTNETACPGSNLYAALPKIRRRAARIMQPATRTGIAVERPASVKGVPALGSTLSADAGTWTPASATPAYLWFRGDRRIRGAREASYAVRPRDVGERLSCRVRLVAEGLETVEQRTEPLPLVTAEAVLDVVTSVRRRVVAVAVTVRAPDGVRPQPGGEVTVTVGSRSRSATLQDGQAVVRFGRHHRHPRGRFDWTVDYAGEAPFTGASATGTVRVD